MDEFSIIQNYFNNKKIKRNDVITGTGDDCAIVQPPNNQELLVTTDTLVSDVHFFSDADPYDIGYKAVAVNLSDLAAMGATPYWVTGCLTIPNNDEVFLKGFSKGLFALLDEYNVALIGGDLTHGPLSITIQAMGFAPKGKAIKRSGAQPYDKIYVTNYLGDPALALKVLKNEINIPENFKQSILTKFNRPKPRLDISNKLIGIATAAIDLSDGLTSDLKHILKMSNVGAKIYLDKIPLSNALTKNLTREAALELAIMGGDDYEICFTAPASTKIDFPAFEIGVITEKTSLQFIDSNGIEVTFSKDGYKHF